MTDRNHFKKYTPLFFEGFDEEDFYFDTLEELLSNDLVANWTRNPFDLINGIKPARPYEEFHKFSMSENKLMAELEEGYEWWIVGFIKYPERLNLPGWKAHYKE